jgi:hypothetical protein
MKELYSNDKHAASRKGRLVFLDHNNTAGSVKGLNRLEGYLREGLVFKGKKKILLESVDMTKKEATRIVERVNSGSLASKSFLSEFFMKSEHREPSIPEDMARIQEIERQLGEFSNREMEIVDNFQLLNRGVDIMLETRSNASGLLGKIGSFDRLNRFENRLFWITKNILDGKFEKGARRFKRFVSDYSVYNLKREKRLVDKMVYSENEKENLFVTGVLGASHSGLGHVLRGEGFEVKRTFPDKGRSIPGSDKNYYLFGPFDELVRKAMFFPEKKIDDTEWMKYAIGSASQLYITKVDGEKRFSQKGVYYLRSMLSDLTDDGSMHNLELRVKKEGFDSVMRQALVRTTQKLEGKVGIDRLRRIYQKYEAQKEKHVFAKTFNEVT